MKLVLVHRDSVDKRVWISHSPYTPLGKGEGIHVSMGHQMMRVWRRKAKENETGYGSFREDEGQ